MSLLFQLLSVSHCSVLVVRDSPVAHDTNRKKSNVILSARKVGRVTKFPAEVLELFDRKFID